MKKITVIFLIGICLFGFYQYNLLKNDAVKIIRNRGVIYIGTTGDYPPMSYFDRKTKTYTGFDVELARDLADELGVKIEFINTSWSSLTEDTVNEKFDAAFSGITITKDRKRHALMSKGYIKNGKTVLCRKKDKYTSIEDINKPNVRVMENPGGLNEQFAKKYFPNAKIIIHQKNEEIPNLIAKGKADVMITEVMEALYYSNRNSNLIAPIANNPFTNGQIGVLLPKKNKSLLKYVNKFLSKKQKDGRIDELKKLYIE